MELTTALWYAVGLILLLIVLQVLAAPLEIAVRVAGSSVLGGLVIWAINLFGGWMGFHLGLNPVSAAVAGMLGAPGVVGLAVIRWILS